VQTLVCDEAVSFEAGGVGDALEDHCQLVAPRVEHAALHQVPQAGAPPTLLPHLRLPLATLHGNGGSVLRCLCVINQILFLLGMCFCPALSPSKYPAGTSSTAIFFQAFCICALAARGGGGVSRWAPMMGTSVVLAGQKRGQGCLTKSHPVFFLNSEGLAHHCRSKCSDRL